MSAARLDPFSARLHAIHRRGAKAKPPKPALQEESAPEGATTGMPGSMSYVSVQDEGQGSMSYVSVQDEGQGSMSYAPVEDDQWSWKRGHDGLHARGDDDEPESPRDATDDADLSGHAPVSGHRPVSGWGAAAPRQTAQDEDTQDQIRELRRRVEELENEMHSLKAALNRLTHSGYGLMDD